MTNQYDQGAHDRTERMGWWHEARFGMFVHWGLYSQLGRHEWAMNRERIPLAEYEPLAESWQVKDRPAREWAKLAKEAGMKYMVMTTKHHEGLCLWDTQQTDYNAVKLGPKRDLVQEFVDACREFDLKVGFYYSLMDWHHPDGTLCVKDEAARRRFLDFTQGCVNELMSNYGKIDVLWYDVSWPLSSPELWESAQMNQKVRELQPEIIINNRSQLPEDFGTPEEHITAEEGGRAWEACMTFNGSWGYLPYTVDEDWHSVRNVVSLLQKCTAGGGNLLLNIGPKPDGSVPEQATERLQAVGKWLEKYGEAVYGQVDLASPPQLEWMLLGAFTRKANAVYYWVSRWPGSTINLGGFQTPLKQASLLDSETAVSFRQDNRQIVLSGLPEQNPDGIAATAVIKLEFESEPIQKLGTGYWLPEEV